MSTPRGVVLLGKGDLTVRLGQWLLERDDFHLQGVVPVVPEPSWTASLGDWARSRGVPVAESGAAADAFTLPGVPERVDLAISVFYDRLLRPSFLERCDRAVNLHNGPLPRYRGVSPIAWALENGETSHGVTLHDIAPGVDDGGVIAQTTYSLYPEVDEVVDVYARALDHGWLLLVHALPRLDQLRPRPQDESLATTYRRSDDHRLVERAGLRRPGR